MRLHVQVKSCRNFFSAKISFEIANFNIDLAEKDISDLRKTSVEFLLRSAIVSST